MENEQLLPFERNRFYAGKLLTSADFLSEQTYLNNKRRFLNSVMFGNGVVCGLEVYNLDDTSVIVESGVAIDGAGREIVIESAVIRKLSALDGFSNVSGARARLLLKYREETVHPVYSVMRKEHADEDYEMNHVREGWELILTDALDEADPACPDEFLSRVVLYEDADYVAALRMPANVSCGATVGLILTVRKLSGSSKALSVDCVIQTPAFTCENGGHELHVTLDDVRLEQGEELRREYPLTARGEPAPESFVLAKSALIHIRADGEPKAPAEDPMMKVNVLDIPLRELIGREVGRVNLETALAAGSDAVVLADLTLHRSHNAYIVEKVENRKRYIRTMATETLRRELAAYFGQDAALSRPDERVTVERPPEFAPLGEPRYATGICEIPLGVDARKGEIFFSDEIMHGLGDGNVHVSVGFEYICERGREGEAERHTIYGNTELFAKEAPPVTHAETAVKVYAERGSFVIAARVAGTTNYATVPLRWLAVKLPSGDESFVSNVVDMSIAARTPTAVIGMRKTHYFAVDFKNMEPCTLSYELTEKNSGEISSDGIYTAPAREGVYEIRISCADMPLISTYAYAVVKKDVAES